MITATDNKVKLRGVTESSQVDNIRLTATISGTSSSDTEDFSVVAIQKVEWIVITSSLDNNPHPTAPVGLRIFAEQTPLLQNDLVNVRATITPAVPGVRVFFRSIDVDDPSANMTPIDNDPPINTPPTASQTQDNRGSPKDGQFTANSSNKISATTVPDTTQGLPAASATVECRVTLQPGDNFRVVATCIDQNVANPAIDLTQVQAQQNDGNMSTGMARVKDAMGNFILSDLTTAAAVKASDVLTVWRKLHMEVDSMGPIPAHPDPEANVVKGNITSITGTGTLATRVNVNQNLDDGSARLDNSSNTGNGRFENGTIIIGTGPQARPTPNLRGNGTNFVETPTGVGFDIPYAIVRAGTLVTQGQVVALAGTTFMVTGNLSSARAGDTFRLAGVSMTIQSISTQNNTVTVQQLVNIPFELRDDDAATHPFNVDTSLMQFSDDPARNLFAPAYIRPEYDLGTGPVQPSFNLNVLAFMGDNPTQELLNQLSSGHDIVSSNNYWVAYIQGAFQEDVLVDGDPDVGQVTLGSTPTHATDPPSNRQQGSLVYIEAIRDAQRALNALQQCLGISLLQQTMVHEVGHQFGLGEGPGGIMNQGCIPLGDQHFLPSHIAAMRGRSHP